MIRILDAVSMRDVAAVGGKAASLGELLQAGFRVCKGFIVTADETRLTPKLTAQIYEAFDQLGLTRVAVRSSGVSEDAKDQSWAGQFATFLHVDRDGLLQAIQACWDSAKADRVQAYGKPAALAVLVQQMVHSDTSGVAFSVNPITANQTEVMIEAVYGLCETLVQGIATPDNYLLTKSDGRLVEQGIATKTTQLTYAQGQTVEQPVEPSKQNLPALAPKQLTEIVALVRRIEQHYGFPVDIEWSYQDAQLYLLQARPITTM